MEIRLIILWLPNLSSGLLPKPRRSRVLLVLGLIIASPVVYWLASPLFTNIAVDEALPPSTGPVLSTIATGAFVDADSFHQTSGTATVLRATNESLFVRLTNFKTTNGPDLFVVLSTDRSGKNIVYLGGLKGNIGDQNYFVPSNADLSHYKYVLIWCRTFSVLFGSAELS